MRTDTINHAITIARLSFGGDDGVFNTAGFQSALKGITGRPCGEFEARNMLQRHSRVTSLKGGAHWKYTENSDAR